MTIVAGFDLHRAQITFDALNLGTGEVLRGRILATPAAVRECEGRFPVRRSRSPSGDKRTEPLPRGPRTRASGRLAHAK